MRDVPDFVGDCRGRDEKFVGRVGETLARPFEIDHRVDKRLAHTAAACLRPDEHGNQLDGIRSLLIAADQD